MASKRKITSFCKSETEEKDKQPKTRLNYCQLQLVHYDFGLILAQHQKVKFDYYVTNSWTVERLLK